MQTHAVPSAPLPITLEDASNALGDFVATIMKGLDAALAEVGDDRWKDGVRGAVIREASHHALDVFLTEGVAIKTPDQLDCEAVLHLGRFAVARSRSLVLAELERNATA